MNRNTIVKPCLEKVFQQDNIFCSYDAHRISTFTPEIFEGSYWLAENAVLGTAHGRGTTYFVQHQSEQWVLRHYYRGGIIGKLFNDGFIYLGMSRTRAAQEYRLLKKMYQLHLPVPEPIAYRVERHGGYYCCDLITARITNSSDLVDILSKEPIASQQWLAIGKCIAQFHKHGIYHHDLNSHNILIDNENKVWIIDFDRGQQRAVKQQWQQANLARLERSFRKELSRLDTFYWRESDWQLLIEGYLS